MGGSNREAIKRMALPQAVVPYTYAIYIISPLPLVVGIYFYIINSLILQLPLGASRTGCYSIKLLVMHKFIYTD